MNILLESRTFYPAIGGLETVSQQLAEAWQEQGHNVRIATITPLEEAEELQDLSVVRQPSQQELYRHVRWSDVFVQSGISLRSLWIGLLARRPLVFIHHNMLTTSHGPPILNALKRVAAHLGKNVAVSRAVAEGLPSTTTVIPNAFRPSFNSEPYTNGERSGLLFVGRLVSAKGCDLALEALAHLHGEDHQLLLTICGDGPERSALEQQAQALGLSEHVRFEGWTEPSALAQHYTQAEVALVPSRYEPFGIVALEAISCGCPVVAARTGGLPEAVGPCGLLFEPDNARDLARRIKEARTPAVRERLQSHIDEHLARHHIDHIADRYLDVLEEAVEGR